MERRERTDPAKKVMNPAPGAWRFQNPYFREPSVMAMPVRSQKRLDH